MNVVTQMNAANPLPHVLVHLHDNNNKKIPNLVKITSTIST